MSQITEKLKQKLALEEFLAKYKDGYEPREIEYIRRNWQHCLKSKYNMDLLRQIYAELGFLSDDENIYKAFIKILEENFSIERDIIEVGGGRFPSLAKMIALKQKTGTITVYDPRLVTTTSPLPNMKLKKELFTKQTPVSKEQMVIAFMPCEATEPAILAAGENGADFLIALCEGGPHGDEFDYFESIDEWLGSMIYTARIMARKHDLGEIEITDLKEYNDPYPVIYNKRRNSK